MQSRLLSAIALVGLALVPAASGCATQQDIDQRSAGAMSGATAGVSGSGGSSAGGEAKGGAAVAGGSAGSASGGAAGKGSAGSAMAGEASEPVGGAGGSEGEPGSAGAGGAPDECAGGCDDDDPCTTDACLLGHCSHTASTAPCEDDDDPCTSDVCQGGACTHPDNGTCECQVAADCDDDDPCTSDTCTAAGQCMNVDNQSCECQVAADCDDQDPCTTNQCNAQHDCVYTDNGTCPLGTPFVVNSFDSNADWVANITTPGGRALVKTGFANTNLEGTTNVYLAATAAASLEMDVASLVGLTKLRVAIRCVQANSAGMVHVGVWNGTAWSERALSGYGMVPTADYATLDVPLADFGVPLAQVSKMRLRFAPTGGIKEWRVNDVSAAE
jgi:hypothetical protein